ncbi:MAG: efflux RND transporter periplasmic adaptor subunit [Holophaga sp.]|nr:efflux RND transporter periplasmic adaptor subunit [Holophaga sp.]
MRRTILLGIPAAFALAGSVAWVALKPRAETRWRFATIERGEVERKVTATGTANALIQVSVGTQVSGVVTGLYADFNSIVRKGQIVARIDASVNETQVADAQAALRKAKSACDHARADLDRNRRLAAEQLLSEADLEVKTTAFEAAVGDLETARADLQRARINLGYCTIRAPVDGVVVSRLVDVGQTVAASFSTPSLFSIAKDLSRMKVQAAIDEADIGMVQVGQEAVFTVDSYPGLPFHGTVSEVQLNPTVSSNVVTYCVVLEVANVARPSGQKRAVAGVPGTARYIPAGSPVYRGEMALFPGMTATISILTAKRQNVLRVPNLALRFHPAGAPGGNQLWVLAGGVPAPVPVTVGITGSRFSEVSGPGLREGMQVLTGTEAAKPAQAAAPPLGGPPPH